MKRVALIVAAMVAISGQAKAQSPPQFPRTADEFYDAGKAFAGCTAIFRMYEAAAAKAGFPEVSRAAGDQARGWQVAGAFLLVDGLAPAKQTMSARVFEDLVQARLTVYRAKYELDAVALNDELQRDHQVGCEPNKPLQKALIEAMRRGG